jgi:ketosteroid isomerase-like protein
VFRLKDRQVIDIDAHGDIAYTVNSYSYTWHPVGTEPQWHKTKNVHIWKKDPEGRWKLHVDIWNSDVPIGDFENE